MLSKFSDEQLASIGTVIDPQFWMRKFKQHPADIVFVRQLIKESGL